MRPVDVDEAIRQIDMGKDSYNIAFLLQTDSYTSGAFDAIEHDISVLKAVPTLDAVPVVRCRDCKHWCTDSTPCLRGVVDLHFCAVAGFDSTADWFCADGERKEE